MQNKCEKSTKSERKCRNKPDVQLIASIPVPTRKILYNNTPKPTSFNLHDSQGHTLKRIQTQAIIKPQTQNLFSTTLTPSTCKHAQVIDNRDIPRASLTSERCNDLTALLSFLFAQFEFERDNYLNLRTWERDREWNHQSYVIMVDDR